MRIRVASYALWVARSKRQARGIEQRDVAHRVEHCSREGGVKIKEFKILFGSVAERVVKTSPVPVMVVNPYRTG